MQTNQLIESMQRLVHWSSVHAPADEDMDSIRAAYDAFCRNYTPPRRSDIRVEDSEFSTKDGSIRFRLYYPANKDWSSSLPLVFYSHGGGFVVGDLDSHEVVTIPLALALNAVVMVVDYRLAPEHPYPAALDDVRKGWQYITQNAAKYGIDTNKIILAGDSAGGTLTAILAQETKNAIIKPIGQVLIYPALTMVETVPSHSTQANAPLMSYQDLQWYYDSYAPDRSQWGLPTLSPLSASNFEGLPATFIAIVTIDPLADEGRLYAQRLQQAQVSAQIYEGKGLLHGSIRAWRHSDEAKQMLDAIIQAMVTMLKNTYR